jgi:hypothetical protein
MIGRDLGMCRCPDVRMRCRQNICAGVITRRVSMRRGCSTRLGLARRGRLGALCVGKMRSCGCCCGVVVCLFYVGAWDDRPGSRHVPMSRCADEVSSEDMCGSDYTACVDVSGVV